MLSRILTPANLGIVICLTMVMGPFSLPLALLSRDLLCAFFSKSFGTTDS
jgi:hypothetical protein